MKVLVCGSRDWDLIGPIEARLKLLPRGTEIIHGGCRGADVMAGSVASRLGLHVTEFPADWKGIGRSAGFMRNIAMLDEKPDLVIAFWKNGSMGTLHTIRNAEKRGIRTEAWRDR